MSKNTSVSLGEHFEAFVQAGISEGRYKNASEVIRAGLRLLEQEEQKYYSLKKALQDRIDIDVAENFDPEVYLKKNKA